jgi:hypothetical protein
MKQYLSIQGPNKAPREHCIAFDKKDGSNIRVEWSRKRGWYKFGSRKVLIDETHPLGEAIPVFLNTYGDDLDKLFRKDKFFRNCQKMTVFGEFYGQNSFAGWHDPDDEKEILLIDVNIDKKGIVAPKDFIKLFGHLKIPDVVYEGKFNESFIQDVKDGKYPVVEGIVAKGNLPHGKHPHNLWMAKVKTKAWIEKLKIEAVEHPERFKKQLVDNILEQG